MRFVFSILSFLVFLGVLQASTPAEASDWRGTPPPEDKWAQYQEGITPLTPEEKSRESAKTYLLLLLTCAVGAAACYVLPKLFFGAIEKSSYAVSRGAARGRLSK